MTSPEIEPDRPRNWFLVVCGFAGVILIAVLASTNRPQIAEREAPPSDAGVDNVPISRDRPKLPEPVKGAGPHTLKASVVDSAGQPVVGAAVTAQIELGPGNKSLGTAPGLVTTPVVVAISDQQGELDLVGLEPGRHRLKVERDGIYTAEVRFVEVPSSGVRLVVARKVAVVGLVVDGGQPAAGIHIGMQGDGITGTLSATTDARGDFKFDDLAEGVFHVWAWSADRASARLRVARLGKGPFETVVLELGPAHAVSGKVIDRKTDSGVVAAVTLTPESPDQSPRFGRSDGSGAFKVEGVPPGRWRAEAYAPGYVAADAVTFEVGSGYQPTISLTPGAIVGGRVVDQRDGSIEGAVVSLRKISKRGRGQTISEASRRDLAEHKSGLGRRSSMISGQRFVPSGELGVLLGPIPYPPPQGASAVRVASIVDRDKDAAAADLDLPVAAELQSSFSTDSQGRFRVTGLSKGRYRVVVTHRDFADGHSKLFDLDVGGEKKGLRIVLVPGVLLVGEVSDNHGDLVVGATVIAEMIDDKESRLMAATADDGKYRLGPIASDVAVTVSAVGYGTARRTIKVGPPALSVQRRTEDFKLIRADAVLSGLVRDASGFPVRKASVSIGDEGLSARSRRVDTDDNGRFLIDKLAPGEYAVKAFHPDFLPTSAKGKTGSEMMLRLPFGGGIDGEIRDSHTRSPVAGARVIARGPKGKRKETAAAADGGFQLLPLPPGSWVLTIQTPGYVRVEKTVAVIAGTKPKQLTAKGLHIDLSRGATVAGVVRDAAGQRVRAVTVSVGSRSTKTDQSGSFRLRDVATGSVTIEASLATKKGSLTLPLRPGDELVTLQIEIK